MSRISALSELDSYIQMNERFQSQTKRENEIPASSSYEMPVNTQKSENGDIYHQFDDFLLKLKTAESLRHCTYEKIRRMIDLEFDLDLEAEIDDALRFNFENVKGDKAFEHFSKTPVLSLPPPPSPPPSPPHPPPPPPTSVHIKAYGPAKSVKSDTSHGGFANSFDVSTTKIPVMRDAYMVKRLKNICTKLESLKTSFKLQNISNGNDSSLLQPYQPRQSLSISQFFTNAMMRDNNLIARYSKNESQGHKDEKFLKQIKGNELNTTGLKLRDVPSNDIQFQVDDDIK